MKRPAIEALIASLYRDLSVPPHAIHVAEELVRYIQYLEVERKAIDPKNVDIFSKKHDIPV